MDDLHRTLSMGHDVRGVAAEQNAVDTPIAPAVPCLTVTGTSAESGDDGEVGRGNRVSGLITPYRCMTMEAVAGKNPLTHVGKLHNLMASRISQRSVADVPEISDVQCILASQIGHSVSDPQIVDVSLKTAARLPLPVVGEKVGAIVREELERVETLRSDLLNGRLQLC